MERRKKVQNSKNGNLSIFVIEFFISFQDGKVEKETFE